MTRINNEQDGHVATSSPICKSSKLNFSSTYALIHDPTLFQICRHKGRDNDKSDFLHQNPYPQFRFHREKLTFFKRNPLPHNLETKHK